MSKRLSDIFERRSIRKYKRKDVSEKAVKTLLKAAMAAPSACKTDPWRFIVVRDKKTLKKVAALLPHGKMLSSAPVGIIVCGDLDKAHINSLSYMLQDCSAAIENLLLAASILGLGACWLGVHPREDRIEGVRKLFKLPENIVPISGISIGHPAEKKKPRTRYEKSYVRYEKW